MKRYLLSLLIFSSAIVPLSAQQLKFNTPDPMKHGARADIHSSPGIVGDNYYILYNDHARKKDAGDIRESYLKVYSVAEGNLLHSVNLTALVSDINKDRHILFTDVFLWKNRLLGMYLSWNTSADQVDLYAQLLDEKGNKFGNPALLETMSPLANPKNKGEKIIQVNGKSALDMASDLHYAFNHDSSCIAMYYTGNSWQGFKPALINPELRHISKWAMDFGENTQILQCVPGGKDSLLALVKRPPEADTARPAYSLYVFGLPLGNPPVSIPLTLPGKVIQDAGFRFDSRGDILVTGAYTLSDKPTRLSSTYGVFVLKMDTRGTILHSDIQPFSEGMISDLAGYKAASKGRGLGKVLQVNQLIPLAGTGMASVGQSFNQGSEVAASPIILSPHYDVEGHFILTGIDSMGEVKWISYLKHYYEDVRTTATPVPFYATRDKDNHLVVIYDENGERRSRQDIHIDWYGDQGIRDRNWLPLPRTFETLSTSILWNTACNVNDKAIMVAYYNPWKKQMGTLKIALSKGVDVTANP